jgi:uncharacterized protein (TIGR00297 family)
VAIEHLLDRATWGAVVAAAVALIGYKVRTLTVSGAAAGFIAGTLCVAAGWSWGFLLLGLFVAASILSKIGESRKAVLLDPVVEKSGARDAWQVAANGAVYAAAAAGAIWWGGAHWFAVGIGALAASTADTWSTEIGTLGTGTPRLIVSGKSVPTGTSGGITVAGCAGAFVGAAAAAAAAQAFRWPVSFSAAFAGGIAGALGDSLAGATIQSKRWCEECRASTERKIHNCGVATVRAGRFGWLDNDGVNFFSTIVGGLVTLLVSRLGHN